MGITMKPSSMVSIADIRAALGCSLTRAREIMLMELAHIDISTPGARKPTWRAKRTEFERWMQGREQEAGNAALERFARKYIR